MIKTIEVSEDFENPDPNKIELYRRCGYMKSPNTWSELAQKRCKKPSRILDLGCGTGRIAISLSKLGHEVIGVDANPQMLRVAKDLYPNFIGIQSRIENLNLGCKFDGVILAALLFSYCGDSVREQIISTVIRHLKIGGWLAIEIFDLSWLEKTETIEFPNQKIICKSLDAKSLIWSVYIKHFFKDVYFVEQYNIKGFGDDDLRLYMEPKGLIVSEKIVSSPITSIHVALL